MLSRVRVPWSWLRSRPAVLVLLLGPLFGEGLSGSTTPLGFLAPWHLAFMVALYGCGALLCRELAFRFGLGLPGLCLLGAAYGVWEEALVDRYWFFPQFWADSGVGTYSVVGQTNILLAVHLTAFHAAISVCCSVLVVGWIAPRARQRRWTGNRGLAAAAVVLALTPLVYGEFDRRPSLAVLIGAGVLLVMLVATAFAFRRPHLRDQTETTVPAAPSVGRRGLGGVAFLAISTHWVLTYAVAETALAWPLGIAAAVAPIVLGAVVVHRLTTTGADGPDAVRVVRGLLLFFVLLNLVVALNGAYDVLVTALVTAYGVHLLRRKYLLDCDMRTDQGQGVATAPTSATRRSSR